MPFHYYTLPDGSYVTGGGGTPAEATPVTGPAVTYPTVGSVALDGFFPGVDRPHLWFKFTAAATGDILIDTELTFLQGTYDHDISDKPYTALNIYVPNAGVTAPASVGDLHAAPASITFADRKRAVLRAVAGVTYWIRVGNNLGDGEASFVVQVSGYGVTTDWYTISDQQLVVVPPDPTGAATNDLPSPGVLGFTQQPNHLPSYVAWNHSGHHGLGWDATWDQWFEGHYGMQQTFGGPEPGADSDSWPCIWRAARRGEYGQQNWGPYPDGVGGFPGTWDGTEFGEGGAGFGTCLTHTATVDSAALGRNAGDVWVQYISDEPGGFSAHHATMYSRAPLARLNLTAIRTQAGPNAGTAFPATPAGYESGDLIWESDNCTISGLDVAPDEFLTADRASPAGDVTSDFAVQWYINATPADENPGNTWGPDRAEGTWWGNGAGPESLTADHVTATYVGGLAAWEALPSGVITNALAYEAAGAAYGVRAIALSPEQLSDAVPFPIAGTPAENLSRLRGLQTPSYRVNLVPSRYKWSLLPTMPSVLTVTAQIAGAPDEVRRRFVQATQ